MTRPSLLLTLLSVALVNETAEAQCADWTYDFGDPPGTNLLEAYAASWVHDDGSGPALYVSCGPTIAGLAVKGIARWNGTEWSALGTGLTGSASQLEPSVRAMATFDDGSGPALYVGGRFDTAGGLVAENLARWDGTSWSAVATGFGSSTGVYALEVWDDGSGPALFVAGNFTSVSGVPANHLARWDGTTWSEVGGGLSFRAWDLEVFEGELHVAGTFTAAGGVAAPGLARWDGASWTPLTGGLAVDGGSKLFAWDDGSGPVLVGSVQVGGLGRKARWDGTAWTQMGSLQLGAWDFQVHDDGSGPGLYSTDTTGVVRWDGSDWVQVAGGPTCYDLGEFDEGNGPRLFAFGGFETAGEPEVDVGEIARWNGGTLWSPVGPPGGQGLDNTTSTSTCVGRELHVADLGNGSRLYVGGTFDRAGETVVAGVAAWDGTTWSPVGSIYHGPNPGHVEALQAFDDGNGMALFAGGSISWIGVSALNMARWNGTAWENIGDFNGGVSDLELYDHGPGGDRLYAAGDFIQIEGVPFGHIARWNGSNWVGLPGGGLDRTVQALVVFDDGNGPALFAGGNFLTAGATAVSKIARYDGTSWSDVGGGVAGGNIFALCVHDDGSGPALFAAGKFTSVGTTGAAYIAKWDGTAWSSLAGGNPDGPVYALTVHDEGDGRGPGLYVGGDFGFVGAAEAARIARWDPSGWSPFSQGVDRDVLSLASFDDGDGWPSLFAAGSFHIPGKGMQLARWSNECPCQGTSYCTAGTTTNGCQALISSTGSASGSASSGFDVAVAGVEGEKQGLLFFGTSGGKATPWGTGSSFLCVKGPSKRTPVQASGGTAGLCNGAFALDFNAWMTANPSKAPPPGAQVWMQAWFRDPPAPLSTALSDGLTFNVCP